MEKDEFFIEWWTLGNSDTDIESGKFHLFPSHLNNFIKKFVAGDKRHITFLKRCKDNKVLINNQGRA